MEMCKCGEDGRTGLQRFDPARGSFSTYVYALVLTKTRNARSRRMRELALMPYSHDAVSERDDASPRGKDKAELKGRELDNHVSDQKKVEFQLQIENVRVDLQGSGLFHQNGRCGVHP